MNQNKPNRNCGTDEVASWLLEACRGFFNFTGARGPYDAIDQSIEEGYNERDPLLYGKQKRELRVDGDVERRPGLDLGICAGGKECLQGCLTAKKRPAWWGHGDGYYSMCEVVTSVAIASTSKLRKLREGSLTGHGVCVECNCLVNIDGHTKRCRQSDSMARYSNGTAISKRALQSLAVLGDELQKYHFVAYGMLIGKVDGYQLVSRLFTNASQKEFAMMPGRESLREKYFLTPASADHTCGTAVEAEYQISYGFRKEYMRWVCESVDWRIDERKFEYVLTTAVRIDGCE